MRRRHGTQRKASSDNELWKWAALFSSLQLDLNAVSNTFPPVPEISFILPVAECPWAVPFPTPCEDAAEEGPIWLQFHFLRLYINTAIKSNDMQIKELMASCGAWAVSSVPAGTCPAMQDRVKSSISVLEHNLQEGGLALSCCCVLICFLNSYPRNTTMQV